MLGIFALSGALFVMNSDSVHAESEVQKLRNQIEERNNKLAEIEKEIAEYKEQLQKVGAEKSTLQSAINQLELERKKVQADINYTQNRIGATDLEINQLSIEIEETEGSIDQNKLAISEVVRRLNESDRESLVAILLRYDNLSEFWNSVDELEQIRSVMNDKVKSLVSQKILLEGKQKDNTKKREELVDLKTQYVDQNAVLTSNKSQKNNLLEETKSEEAEYQKILKEKQEAYAAIERELRDFESKLQFILDPNTIPPPGTPVFNWPLDKIIVTQLFGGTEFAKTNPGVYGRAYHPGVDFGAPVGTKIFAPLSGIVRATGNTDEVAGCYSWGKWTLIDHANGLTSLYAHQSVISVTPGQKVSTGDVIGYVGRTGYVTGPHLHFTVYARYDSSGNEAVKVRKFNEIKSVTNCGSANTPTAPTDAYLDPTLYLPAL